MPTSQPHGAPQGLRYHDLVVGIRAASRQGGEQQRRSGAGERPGAASATTREGVWLRAPGDCHRPAYGRPSGGHWLAAIATRRGIGIAIVVLSWFFLAGYAVTRLMR